MKKPFLLFVCVFAFVQLSAQSPQRTAGRTGTDEFTLSYVFSSDSLKGFFMVTEQFTGKSKLVKTNCKWPWRFENDRLQFSGEKMTTGLTVDFTFKILEQNISISGNFRSENFGHQAFETTLEEIKVKKTEPFLTADAQNPVLVDRHIQTPGEMYPRELIAANKKQETTSPSKIDDHSSTSSHQQSAISNQQPTITFRVQLAASTVPMDKQKIAQLSGLEIPVQEDRIDGYYKYTIGSETSLKAAQEILNKVTKEHFKKPFIVAYSQKERITIQQAMAEINKNR